MIGRIDLSDPTTKELSQRIIVRMADQAESELIHVLSKLFPNAPVLRLKSVAYDLHNKRSEEFENMLVADEVEMDIFNTLSSADKDQSLILARSQFEPTRFELILTCARTPFKELFAECMDITCESCIEGRITTFNTNNDHSKSPWHVKIERVEQRRLDLCKNCGQILTKKSEINLQNERLLYKCDYCGHKGWTKAK